MELCVLGWYGTETLGDRAILDGIIKIMRAVCPIETINLGSLYPFFTERTLYEDKNLFEIKGTKIVLFNEKEVGELKRKVSSSDIVIMGGGPLMDLSELYLVYQGFAYAKKQGKSTVIMGCGYGPIKTDEYTKLCRALFKKSDLIIFRDACSQKEAQKSNPEMISYVLDDPAIASIQAFKDAYNAKTRDYIAVNFRDFPVESYGDTSFSVDAAVQIVKSLMSLERDVRLVPMHTFFIGGDDREFLARIKANIESDRVDVDYTPNSLTELYQIYTDAFGCIGMRYHSVVIQSILNGNNCIVDYTSKNGKIAGFLEMIDPDGFYKDRIISTNCDRFCTSDFSKMLETGKRHKLRRFNTIEEYRKVIVDSLNISKEVSNE